MLNPPLLFFFFFYTPLGPGSGLIQIRYRATFFFFVLVHPLLGFHLIWWLNVKINSQIVLSIHLSKGPCILYKPLRCRRTFVVECSAAPHSFGVWFNCGLGLSQLWGSISRVWFYLFSLFLILYTITTFYFEVFFFSFLKSKFFFFFFPFF